ncbi:D-arabinono-1,4-lactone oxidase [Streptomonospora litoralis]|uniref:L-gulono-1,4-lactone dehydrogenase n=1 Tax=Streptomonospora litoralis TaxID=2498135 RepID=A0A4P6Q2G6_9ACTN|nr:D-arabinono-1,4-lactone oxidase [Streptomonospora litoralis]QBI54745.1 L-gulono-1,4-lactone dehydrogenase [Streptomonospora litoralis]
MSTVSWRTWGRTQQARPLRIASPSTTAGVAAAVRTAAEEGLRIRMVGAGHSFTGVALTDGVLLSPTGLARLRGVDAEAGTVTVEAGLPLCDLNEALHARGLALANMGDIAVQTAAGAIQTGTHGTGRDSGGLAAQVCGMELVLADGSVVECSAEREAELFAAARVGLGAFGVVTALTLRTDPAFLLHAREEPMRLEEVLERLPQLRAENEHFEFFWFPHTGRTNTKRNNRTAGPAEPLRPWRAWLDDDFLSNTVFEGVNRLGRRAPAAIPAINQVAARALSARGYTDASHRVFASTRRVRFVETEYAVPAEALPDVLAEIRRILDSGRHRIGFPIEVRFAPADDVWLSTAYGRDTAYVAAHVYHRRPYADYFRELEAVFTAAAGRPHWGKLHTRGPDYLGGVYPRFEAAMAVRDRVDPDRRFANAYLDSVLGA